MKNKIKRCSLLAILLATLLAVACKNIEYVPVETVRTEYVDKVRELHDTLLVNDKETVYVNGDTVRVTRYVDRYKIVHQRDTLCVERCDTISVPYPVERKQAISEKVYTTLGKIFCLLLFIIIAILIYRYKFLNKK